MNLKQLMVEVNAVTQHINNKDVDLVTQLIKEAKKLYVVGEGRSGLMLKAFAMRLSRLEKLVYVVGETVTPPVAHGDLMIVLSGSGETKTVLQTAKIARMLKTTIIVVTAEKNSSLSKIAHKLVIIPAHLPKRLGSVYQLRELVGVPERPPLASVFEIAALLFLEVVAFKLDELWSKKTKFRRLLPS